jgi:hypothetical protein
LRFQVDLVTNRQDARREDFYVIDQVEATIPGCLRAKYVEALSALAQEQGALIKRYMPEKLDIFAKPPKKPREGDGEDKIKAKLDAMESLTKALKYGKLSGKSKDEKAMLGTELEQKMGECSLCSTFHYFYSKGEPSFETAGDSFFACPKYKAMTVDQRTDVILQKKACASCRRRPVPPAPPGTTRR